MPDQETKTDKVATTTAPATSKVLWWSLGILAVLTVVTIIIVAVTKKKSALDAVLHVVDFVDQQVSNADLEAKIKMAEAEKLEQVKIDELKKLREIKDVHTRNRRLAEIL